VEEIMKKRKVASTSHSSSPKQPETLPDDAVLFNPLHDHESLWWIACWALLHYIPANHNPESDECIEYASRIFHPTVFEAGRIEVLSLGLPKKIIALVPREFELLVDTVALVRHTLCSRYKTAEEDLPKVDEKGLPKVNEKAFDGVWQEIHREYAELARDFRRLGLKVKMTEKRKFDTVEDSDMNDGHFLNNKRGRVD
jgi:hypothetical protein